MVFLWVTIITVNCVLLNITCETAPHYLLLCEDDSVKMIRRAETAADYFATFDFCGIMDKYLK